MSEIESNEDLSAKENRFLKQTILAFRDELEKAEVFREECLQQANMDSRREIDQLKVTALELRDQFERSRVEFDEERQKLAATEREESRQLRDQGRPVPPHPGSQWAGYCVA